MDILVYGIAAILFVLVVLFAVDQYLCLRDVEADLKIYHGDVVVARDLTDDPAIKVHYQAVASALRTIIRKNFNFKE